MNTIPKACSSNTGFKLPYSLTPSVLSPCLIVHMSFFSVHLLFFSTRCNNPEFAICLPPNSLLSCSLHVPPLVRTVNKWTLAETEHRGWKQLARLCPEVTKFSFRLLQSSQMHTLYLVHKLYYPHESCTIKKTHCRKNDCDDNVLISEL